MDAELDRAEAALLALDPAAARTACEGLLADPTADGAVKHAAAELLARALLELGDYPEAIQWLELSVSKYPTPGCGTWAAFEKSRAQLLREAWSRMLLPLVEAEIKLRDLLRKAVYSRKAWFFRRRELATTPPLTEIHYLLGMLLLQQGRAAEARSHLELAASRCTGLRSDYAGRLARAHLERLRTGT
jgi:tetratricopeptide (TPR) repeat protein